MLCDDGLDVHSARRRYSRAIAGDGKKRVALVREMVGSDEIASNWLTAVVLETGHFMWVDTYPSLEVWAAVQTAWANSEEAVALEEELEANETCSTARSYRSVAIE